MKRIALASIIAVSIMTTLAISTIAMDEEFEEERIYIDYENPYKLQGYIKAEDMPPGSGVWFVYPYSNDLEYGNKLFRIYQLIRLPSWNNSENAFRAYNIIDIGIENSCMVKYWEWKHRLEDPCSGSVYRAEDGLGISGPITLNKQPQKALPKLDIGIDKEGYLYVKKPRFDVMHNGVIGYGRFISDAEVLNTSRELLEDLKMLLKDKYGYNANIPLILPNGEMLMHITYNIPQDSFEIDYTDIHDKSKSSMRISYCDCSYKLEELVLSNKSEKFKIFKTDKTYIYQYIHGSIKFTDNGFMIQLYTEPVTALQFVTDFLDTRIEEVDLMHAREELLSIIKNSKIYQSLLEYEKLSININPKIGLVDLYVNDNETIIQVYAFIDPLGNITSYVYCETKYNNHIYYYNTINNTIESLRECIKISLMNS